MAGDMVARGGSFGGKTFAAVQFFFGMKFCVVWAMLRALERVIEPEAFLTVVFDLLNPA